MVTLLGSWIEYFTEFVAETLQKRHQLLPVKARLREPTQVYWVEAIGHNNFDYLDQQVREIFSNCLEVSCKLHDNMRVLKLREYWDKNDDNLVLNNRFTKQGLSAYYRSLDTSFKFNLRMRDDFLIRQKFRTLKATGEEKDGQKSEFKSGQINKSVQEDGFEDDGTPEVDAMMEFFAQKNYQNFQKQNDRFHWRKWTIIFIITLLTVQGFFFPA